MLSEHIRAVADLHECVKDILKIAEMLPEGQDKYRLIARAEVMEKTANEYAESSLALYDQILGFAMSVAL